MQHITSSKTSNVKSSNGAASLLSLYVDPPEEELTLDEFELLSLDRLQLLRAIETLKTRGFEDAEFNRKLAEYERKLIGAAGGRKEIYAQRGLHEQRRDQIGHFILRLSFCRTEDLRRWFITQEVALFKYRLDYISDEDREQFMFQVPFQQALSLVGSRSVYLEGGYAFVPLQRLVSILTTRFRMHLSRALAEASSHFEIVESDSRIGPLLKNMNKQFIGNDFGQRTSSVDKLTPEKVDEAAEINMPVCMKNLHNNLKREHKLKHWGRLQYTLFLKGAGLDMEGAQVFWESHFTKVMTHDQFVKSYSYSFRHMFGKEGARKNYTPYSCMKIIMGTPPEPGAHHGCPYKHMGDTQLSSLLGSLKLGTNDMREIVSLAKGSNYQLACQKHFDVTHPGHLDMDLKSDAVANHPNQWFLASVNYHKVKNGGSASASQAASQSQASITSPDQAAPNFIKA